jgi:hypothetical protein
LVERFDEGRYPKEKRQVEEKKGKEKRRNPGAEQLKMGRE